MMAMHRTRVLAFRKHHPSPQNLLHRLLALSRRGEGATMRSARCTSESVRYIGTVPFSQSTSPAR
jgi:hypothetical protein